MFAMRERAGRVVPHTQVVDPLRDEVAERSRRDVDERLQPLPAIVPAVRSRLGSPVAGTSGRRAYDGSFTRQPLMCFFALAWLREAQLRISARVARDFGPAPTMLPAAP